MKFFIGLHMPNHAARFDRCMISVNRLRDRKKPFEVQDWMMDSGAFTEVTTHGGFRHPPAEYAEQVERWARNGRMVAAVAQDWMCEPFAVSKTGKSVEEHQALTIERYAQLRTLVSSAYVLPVLQGFQPAQYAEHVRAYGSLLPAGAWVGVGSVCKRNGKVGAIEDVLMAIHRARPDLRLHGFGLKLTALASLPVRELLHSADSMAWSWSARRQGRNGNDPAEAERFAHKVQTMRPLQRSLFSPRAGAA